MVIIEKLKENMNASLDETSNSNPSNTHINSSDKTILNLPVSSSTHDEDSPTASSTNSQTDHHSLTYPSKEPMKVMSTPSPSRPPKPASINIRSNANSGVVNTDSSRTLIPLPQASNLTYSEGLYEIIDNENKSSCQLSNTKQALIKSSEKTPNKVEKYFLSVGKKTFDRQKSNQSLSTDSSSSHSTKRIQSKKNSVNKDSYSLFNSTTNLSIKSFCNNITTTTTKSNIKWKLFELFEKKELPKIAKYTCALHINPDETVKTIVQASKTCTRQSKQNLPYLILDRNALAESNQILNIEHCGSGGGNLNLTYTNRNTCLNDEHNQIDNNQFEFRCLNSNSWLTDTITVDLLKNSLDLREAGLLDIREGEKLEVMCIFMEPRLLVRNTIGQYGLVRQSEVRNQ
ncbi:unnamed protein product [Schistosoma turkestanicum]|nr:unnamed protein product [Schistosoma turkestanicum]